jgi:hypothetical protein
MVCLSPFSEVPEKVIQQTLRHANVSTTNTYYIKTVPALVTDVMEKLQQALPESLSGNELRADSPRHPSPSTSVLSVRWDGGPGQS